jgi:adenosylcobyric acid synthase
MRGLKNNCRPLMFVGTGSDVGKSTIVAGMGRMLKQDGFNPAPFKAQNMALNSFVTKDGSEIGRAQAMQAEACKIEPEVQMNPILLKPNKDTVSQVVLNGRPIGNFSARDYFNDDLKKKFFQEVKDSFLYLSKKYSPILVEGAGSISEMNLWERDIVNMPVARFIDAAVFLVADIDKGGVIGNIYGHYNLLKEDDKKLIKGFIINKFRGDVSLFEDGKKIIEQLTGVPVVGVIPYFRDIYLDEEDSLNCKKRYSDKSKVFKVAVVLLKHMSNFTDFAPFERIDDVNLFYAENPEELDDADLIIVPGSKNTISDMLYLKRKGFDRAIKKHVNSGKGVIGICGGFQILGRKIFDPYGVESDVQEIDGIGIFPIVTRMTKDKKTVQRSFRYKNYPEKCIGYEIHMGETTFFENSPLNFFEDGSAEGFLLNEKCFGTYIHGIFDNSIVLRDIIRKEITLEDFAAFKDRQYDKLADILRSSLNINYIYDCMSGKC